MNVERCSAGLGLTEGFSPCVSFLQKLIVSKPDNILNTINHAYLEIPVAFRVINVLSAGLINHLTCVLDLNILKMSV